MFYISRHHRGELTHIREVLDGGLVAVVRSEKKLMGVLAHSAIIYDGTSQFPGREGGLRPNGKLKLKTMSVNLEKFNLAIFVLTHEKKAYRGSQGE